MAREIRLCEPSRQRTPVIYQAGTSPRGRWVDATGIDGFNLCYVVAHETFADVVDLVVPELQRRGRYPTGDRPGTLRAKLFGAGDRVRPSHPASPPGRVRERPGERKVAAAWP